MSILIKGIDLPKGKDRIYLLIEGNKCFNALDPLQTLAEAIQIPTPHGRLIDGDKIEAEAKQTLYGEISYEEIATAPTILEAEE